MNDIFVFFTHSFQKIGKNDKQIIMMSLAWLKTCYQFCDNMPLVLASANQVTHDPCSPLRAYDTQLEDWRLNLNFHHAFSNKDCIFITRATGLQEMVQILKNALQIITKEMTRRGQGKSSNMLKQEWFEKKSSIPHSCFYLPSPLVVACSHPLGNSLLDTSTR
jgi:hypothetical protein